MDSVPDPVQENVFYDNEKTSESMCLLPLASVVVREATAAEQVQYEVHCHSECFTLEPGWVWRRYGVLGRND